MRWVPLRTAVSILGLSPNTLRKYADNGKINVIRLPSGQRRFDVDSYLGSEPGCVVCYCRVSSSKQKNDLGRQVVFMRSEYPGATIIQDIGSGLNFKRKGLRSLLDRLSSGAKLTLVVAHKDRLARFGFELIEYLVKKNGGEIMVLDRHEVSPESELVSDFLSILTVFSGRINGLRKYRKQVEEDQDLPNQRPRKAL